ncbi:CoA pyrophosphatase [Achromobacter sp. GG226]|uniref:NUDIX hydrolase n=1 Tax=Verticiella alkaliphila TaxID=2779529 RepID=UPI00352FFCF6|nr:CoA pyrophosphatase [Verticiella sp. GG226]
MICDDLLREQIRKRLAGFTRLAAAPGEQRAAAVAVAVTQTGHGADLPGMPMFDAWQCDPALILTRRAGSLRHHAGQWALPGGRVDDAESAQAAALRELDEEVGLRLAPPDILGLLDDYVTRSGFVITPVVVWAGAARGIAPNPGEVASLHRISVSEFEREDSPRLDPGELPGQPVLRMPVGNSWIAAPTAAVLYQFREVCLAGRATRVAHFDQPAFAWR